MADDEKVPIGDAMQELTKRVNRMCEVIESGDDVPRELYATVVHASRVINASRADDLSSVTRDDFARMFAGKSFNDERDLFKTLGYPETIEQQAYVEMNRREGLAKRILDAFPKFTWRDAPEVYEDDDTENDTPFEQTLKEVDRRVKLWTNLKKADRLCSLGRYSVLLFGVAGDGDLSQEVKKGFASGPDGLLYVRAYPESAAKVKELETDLASPRFGLPRLYEITLDSATDAVEGRSKVRAKKEGTVVHWTRCLHVAEDTLENEIFGRPKLETIYNRLQDVEKVVGGSAEMFWQGADRLLIATADAGKTFEKTEKEEVAEELAKAMHRLRRLVRLKGVKLEALPSVQPDPRGCFDVLMSYISGATGIPKRILMGSERGELASSQDERAWGDQIMERRQNFAQPVCIRPTVDRLVEWGVLKPPAGGTEAYKVEWTNPIPTDPETDSKIALNKAQAMEKLAGPGGMGQTFSLPERREVMGLNEEPEKGDLEVEEDAEPVALPPIAEPDQQDYFQGLRDRVNRFMRRA